jgi:cytidine deaminase
MSRIVLPAVTFFSAGPGRFSPPEWSLPEKVFEIDEAELYHLVRAAREAAVRAYAPFSHFHVGAAVIMADDPSGATITGTNVENSSYGLTACAERTTLQAAAARGFRQLRLLAVSCPDVHAASLRDRSPCGACRQAIREFATDQTLILIDRGDDAPAADLLDIERLLPFGFRLEKR